MKNHINIILKGESNNHDYISYKDYKIEDNFLKVTYEDNSETFYNLMYVVKYSIEAF